MGFPQSNIDWSKYMKGLEGKANGKFAVVEAKTNPDGSWYRKWSDGWLEQGGYYERSGYDGGWVTINFLKPFVNIKYYFNASVRYDQTSSYCTERISTRTTTNTQMYGDISHSWYACGIGA